VVNSGCDRGVGEGGGCLSNLVVSVHISTSIQQQFDGLDLVHHNSKMQGSVASLVTLGKIFKGLVL
jgi:hypothetical protein